MAVIFISYSRDVRDTVRMLAEDLGALGETVWFDQEIAGGQSWWNRILEKVRDCEVFVAVLHPTALESTACKRECAYAAALGKTILPVLISNDVSTSLLPPGLMEIQYVDYRVQDRTAALALARALKALPPANASPVPLPDPPEAPLSYLGGLAQKVEKPALTQEEQSLLVVDLKEGLADPNTATDARTLLRKLKQRRDLYSRVERQIDELLGADVREGARAAEPSRAHSAPEAFRDSGVAAAAPRGVARFALLVQLAAFWAAGLAVLTADYIESNAGLLVFLAGAAAAVIASIVLLGLGMKRGTRDSWQGGIGLGLILLFGLSAMRLADPGASLVPGILLLTLAVSATALSFWTSRERPPGRYDSRP
jgi:hypothetical protein